ncbi:hypothetical protein NDU88_007723 [Pleurodeles waltl]|uniref:Uncharacterized protein n=1 Tax=Pleurodeles waltl TaxID=8319 RepID=A0AAV7NYS0_PLEWA|nr:hypothetical protein NDU88_007723 [Pleurodeles waltl]
MLAVVTIKRQNRTTPFFMGKAFKKRDKEGGTSQCIKSTRNDEEQSLVQGEIKVTPEPTLQDVLQGIAGSLTALEVKIDTLNIDLGLLWDDHWHLAYCVSTTELDVT